MQCTRPHQQATFWHGTSSSPALTMRQLEAAALSGMHSYWRQQLHRPGCHASGQHSVPVDRVVQQLPVQLAAAAHYTHPAGISTLCSAAASPRHLLHDTDRIITAVSSGQQSTAPSIPQQQALRHRQMRQQQHQKHQQEHWQQHSATQQQQQDQQQQHQHKEQQQQQGQGWRTPATQQAPDRPNSLERTLTVMLSSYSSCAADIADVLLAAEVCNCLNSTHLAAALSRLVRLAAASSASAAAASELDDVGIAAYSGAAGAGSDVVVTAVVPQLEEQWEELQFFKAVAAEHRATSRWHLQPGAEHVTSSEDPDQVDCEYKQQQHLVEQLTTAAAEAAGGGMRVPTLTSICWALAHLQADPPPVLLQQAGAALADQAAGLMQHQSAPKQRWHHIWRQQQQESVKRPRRIIILMWALSKIAADLNDILPQQQQQQLDREDQLTDVHVQQPDGSSVGSISDLLRLILNALTPHMPDLSSQGLLLLLWAAATWTKTTTSSSSSSGCVVPPAAAAGLLSATAAAMEAQALTCRGVSVVMWSVARLGLTPDAAWLSAWAAALQCALPATGPQDLAVSAWGLAHMGCPPPPDWLADFSRRAGAVAPHMAAQELPVLLWAYGRLQYRPPVAVAHALLQRGGRLASTGALSPQGLSMLLWSCGVVGLELPGRWVDGVLAAAGGYLPLFRPREASALWVGLVELGHIPQPGWLDDWWAGSKGLLEASGGQQLVLLLWCAVKLGQAPPRHWMTDWLAAAQGAMARGELSAQGYGLMWDALTQLAPAGTIPSAEWLATYFTASKDPRVLAQLDPLTVEKTMSGLAAVAGRLQDGLELPHDWVEPMLAASLTVLPQAKLVSLANMLQAAGQLALPLSPIWLAVCMCCIQQRLLEGGVLLAPVQYTQRSSSSSSSNGSSSSSDSSSSSIPSRQFIRTVRAGSRSSSSLSAGSRSMVLSARLERRWCQLCLQRVLFGLRAQQMLNPGPQRRLWFKARAVAAGLTQDAAAGVDSSEDGLHAAKTAGKMSNNVSGSGDSSGSDVLAVWPWVASAVHAAWSDSQSAKQALHALSMR